MEWNDAPGCSCCCYFWCRYCNVSFKFSVDWMNSSRFSSNVRKILLFICLVLRSKLPLSCLWSDRFVEHARFLHILRTDSKQCTICRLEISHGGRQTHMPIIHDHWRLTRKKHRAKKTNTLSIRAYRKKMCRPNSRESRILIRASSGDD